MSDLFIFCLVLIGLCTLMMIISSIYLIYWDYKLKKEFENLRKGEKR